MDTFIVVIVCILAGLGAGIGTGFAGMSAAAVIGPMLITFLGVPAYQAVAIGLASDVLASALTAFTYYKNKNLDIKNSLVLLISVLVMTIVGSFVAKFVPEHTMGATMQIAMIILGLKFIIFPSRKVNEKVNNDSLLKKNLKSLIGGVIVGFICGFIGAGGGMMLLLVLTSILGYEIHKAVGTSVLIMSLTALTGSISHFVISGIPNILILLICIASTLIFAYVAAKIANKSSSIILNRVVGVVLIVTSVVILIVNAL